VQLDARKDGDNLELEVSYEGRGIPYHVQAHIFDRYTGRERGGPGLGLALVKALVELHEGWITLESEPAEGASFKIHLPNQSGAGKSKGAPAEDAVKPGAATAAMESLESGNSGGDPIEDVA
jgi:K+-sensing histidine kinase KdpD